MNATLWNELVLIVDREGRSLEDDRQSVAELVAPAHRMWLMRHLRDAFQGKATACFLQPVGAPRQIMLRWSMRPIEDEGEIVSVEVTCHRWRPEYDPPFRPESPSPLAGDALTASGPIPSDPHGWCYPAKVLASRR
ncbi:MAG: hypothetical protein HUU20_29570 [Pirellulales bacterium]|nr:hypothetical protein [Pirellulales bacterium]